MKDKFSIFIEVLEEQDELMKRTYRLTIADVIVLAIEAEKRWGEQYMEKSIDDFIYVIG